MLYLGLLQEFSRRHGCSIHAYVLMTNHVHLLLSTPEARNLSGMMRDVNQIYVQHFNRHQNRCGSTWQGRFKTCLVDSARYFLNCQRYIELNPVRAGIVDVPWLYPWSSYAVNGAGKPSELITPHAVYLGLGSTRECRQAAYRDFVTQLVTAEELGKIRSSVNGGWPLGDEPFVRHVEARIGVPATPGKPGRPRKKTGDGPGTDPDFFLCKKIRDGPGTDPGF